MVQAICLRTSSFIIAVAIFMSLTAVFLDNDYLSFWRTNSAANGTTEAASSQNERSQPVGSGMAQAMPVPQNKDVDEEDREVDGEDIGGSTPEGQKTENIEQKFGPNAKNRSTNNESSHEAKHTAFNKDDGRLNTYEGFKSIRRKRAKSFLVVFVGHSGSTAYTTELRTHSDFEVEFLEPLDHGEFEQDPNLALERAHKLMDSGIAKGKIPGFKIRPTHINNIPEKWRGFVKKYDTRIVWQYRENIVKQAVGEYRHRYLNDSSVVEGLRKDQKPCEGGAQRCRIRIDDMDFLLNQMNDLSMNDEWLSEATRLLRRSDDMLIVKYEDYLNRRERTMKETFDFLGVDYQDTAPQRQKASLDSLCQMVINFQELCNHFHPCQLWRPYLHDDLNDCRCNPGSWDKFDPNFCKRNAWYQSK